MYPYTEQQSLLLLGFRSDIGFEHSPNFTTMCEQTFASFFIQKLYLYASINFQERFSIEFSTENVGIFFQIVKKHPKKFANVRRGPQASELR